MFPSSVAQFDWSLFPQSDRAILSVFELCMKPYRVDETGTLIAFSLVTGEDQTHPSSFKPPPLPMSRLRIFLCKYIVLCWTYISKDRSHFHILVFRRLTRYLQYYQTILAELQSGDRDSFDFWWINETTNENLQHSNPKEPRRDGPLDEFEVLEDNDADWQLQPVLETRNLSQVETGVLDKCSGNIEEWLQEELIRDLGPSMKLEDFELMSDDLRHADMSDIEEDTEGEREDPEEEGPPKPLTIPTAAETARDTGAATSAAEESAMVTVTAAARDPSENTLSSKGKGKNSKKPKGKATINLKLTPNAGTRIPVEKSEPVINEEDSWVEENKNHSQQTSSEIQKISPPLNEHNLHRPKAPQKPSRYIDLSRIFKRRKAKNSFDIIRVPNINSQYTPFISSSDSESKERLRDVKETEMHTKKGLIQPNQYAHHVDQRSRGESSTDQLAVGASVMRDVNSETPNNKVSTNEVTKTFDEDDQMEVDQVEMFLSQSNTPEKTRTNLRSSVSFEVESMDQMVGGNSWVMADDGEERHFYQRDSGESEIEMKEEGGDWRSEIEDSERDLGNAATADWRSEIEDSGSEFSKKATGSASGKKAPCRTRGGRPLGVKNKAKDKNTAPSRSKRVIGKQKRDGSTPSPTRQVFDISTPIIVQVATSKKKVPNNNVPTVPPKLIRKNNPIEWSPKTQAEISVEFSPQSRHIVQNFGMTLG